MLSATRARGIPCYPVVHAHSCYLNCPGGKDIFFIPGTFYLLFCNTTKLCPRNMILREPGTWLSPGMVSIFVLSEEIEHFKVQLAMCFQNSRWRTWIPRYPKKARAHDIPINKYLPAG